MVSVQPGKCSEKPDLTMLTTELPNLQDFGISQSRGFLSDESPLTAFADPYFHAWDLLATSLPSLVSTHAIRREIQTLPLLDASRLATDLEHQRAYVVLAFLIHAFVWTGDSEAENKPEPVVPPQLAGPFLYVCEKVGLQPVLSYAGLCIWNWQVDDGVTSDGNGFLALEQLRAVGSFTGSRGEDAFYHVPVLVEAEGGPLIHLLLSAIQNGDSESLISALVAAGVTLTRMTRHLPKLYPVLDADMFYNTLRPFLAGGKDLPPRGGVVFQKSDGTEEVVACIGGSAAQSSLFQFLDVVLGTEHKAGPGVQRTLFEVSHHPILTLNG